MTDCKETANLTPEQMIQAAKGFMRCQLARDLAKALLDAHEEIKRLQAIIEKRA